MKSNIIKYIIAFFLVVGCVATTTETKAFTIDEVAVVDSIDLNSASSIAIPLCFFYGENVLPAGSWVGSGYVGDSSTNACINQNTYYRVYGKFLRPTWGDNDSTKFFATSFVNFSQDGNGGLNFDLYSFIDYDFYTYNVPSIAGFLHTFNDGNTELMKYMYFLPNSVIFMAQNGATLQYFGGGWVLENYVLYIDFTDRQLHDNFYAINFQAGKAWSLTLQNPTAYQIALGLMKPTVNWLNSLEWSKSYTIVNGGSKVFPNTFMNNQYAVYRGNNLGGVQGGSGFTYSLDTDYIDPDFGGGSASTDNAVTITGGSANTYVIDYLSDCGNKIEMVRSYIQSYEYCNISSSDNTAFELLFFGGGLTGMVSYTGSNTSCQNFVNKHNSFYNIYSSNWSQSDYCSDCGAYQLDNLYDSNAPFINLAYSRDIYSVSYDSSNNMVGLPTSAGVCPSTSAIETTTTVGDKAKSFWNNLVCQFELGNAVNWVVGSGTIDCDIVLGDDRSYISIIGNKIGGYVGEPIRERFYNPLKEQYDLGYNAVSPSTSCSTSTTFTFGDTILYFGSAVILLFLIPIFF